MGERVTFYSTGIRRGSVYVTRREDYTAVTRVVSVKLPVGLVDALDELIEEGFFQNRSDAVREAVRRLIVEYRAARRRNTVPEPGVR
ncbi:MAG: ribbon-helix-helix domain-containing protein [Thermofilum sp.]|nr:ribbon-helix-helix domain-containing protein [Thermofilum sp.]